MAATCNAMRADHWKHGCVALSVVIVDDSEPFIAASRALLEREGLTVLGEASTPEDAVEIVRQQQPDVVLLDLHFGSVSGLDLASRLMTGPGASPVVVLVSTAAAEDVEPLLAGSSVRGFL